MSRGLGDVYKRQAHIHPLPLFKYFSKYNPFDFNLQYVSLKSVKVQRTILWKHCFFMQFSLFFMYLYWKCICKTCLFLHLLYFRYVKKTFPAPLNTSSASVILCLKLFPDEESKIMTLLASYPTTRTASLLPVIANTGLPQLT